MAKRIRLQFSDEFKSFMDSLYLRTWHVINNTDLSVRDLIANILSEFGLENDVDNIILDLQGFSLHPNQSVSLLKDDEVLVVKMKQSENNLQPKKGKKRKKSLNAEENVRKKQKKNKSQDVVEGETSKEKSKKKKRPKKQDNHIPEVSKQNIQKEEPGQSFNISKKHNQTIENINKTNATKPKQTESLITTSSVQPIITTESELEERAKSISAPLLPAHPGHLEFDESGAPKQVTLLRSTVNLRTRGKPTLQSWENTGWRKNRVKKKKPVKKAKGKNKKNETANKIEQQIEEQSYNTINKNYEDMPILTKPEVGQTIAFKIMEVSSRWEPVLSDWKEAKIVSLDNDKLELELLYPQDIEENQENQENLNSFYLEMVAEEGGKMDTIEAIWSDLINPKLMS